MAQCDTIRLKLIKIGTVALDVRIVVAFFDL